MKFVWSYGVAIPPPPNFRDPPDFGFGFGKLGLLQLRTEVATLLVDCRQGRLFTVQGGHHGKHHQERTHQDQR